MVWLVTPLVSVSVIRPATSCYQAHFRNVLFRPGDLAPLSKSSHDAPYFSASALPQPYCEAQGLRQRIHT